MICTISCVNLFRKQEVGVDLFSQPVARQVSSAQVSLTSVFGMGTGGPSPLKTLTMKLQGVTNKYLSLQTNQCT